MQKSSGIAGTKTPKRTIFQLAEGRGHQLLKLVQNLKADVHHLYLPKGLDKHIKGRDPKQDRKRRLEKLDLPALLHSLHKI